MSHSTESSEHKHEEFSLPLFAFTVLTTLVGLGFALRYLAPSVWSAQFVTTIWKMAAAFLCITLVNAFVEYFFHRYVLHTPAVPFLRRLYKQHTLHHALTRIARKTCNDGTGILFIENKFPIIEPEQGEASFFPWYSMAVFALILTPLLAALHWVAPSFPWFFSGYISLAVSLTLYEVLHAINHWPFETWEPLITHPVWKRFWMPVYAFHLRHHAVTDCNESISGFFGLPVADWVFRTCIIPQTLYAQGEEWTPDKFQSPRPRALIAWLDIQAERTVRKHRARAATQVTTTVVNDRSLKTSSSEVGGLDAANADLATASTKSRVYTRGERIANWVTHGVGLAGSIASLTLLIVYSSLRGTAWHVVSFTVFGLTLLALYTVSTIYHARQRRTAAPTYPRFHQLGFSLLIAATYTPFLLTHLRGPFGWTMFGAVWGLCGAGAVFQLFFGARNRLISTLAFIFFGWLLVVAIEPMIASVPPGGLWLLLSGAVSYGIGYIFYRWERLHYHRAVWHTFALGGSTCHCLAMLLFLLPRVN